MGSVAAVYTTKFHFNGPCMPQIALKSGLTGDYLVQADFEEIHYTVYQYIETYPRTLSVVEGHNNVSVPIATSVYNVPVERPDDAGEMKSVNFEYRLPTSEKPLFPTYGAVYRIQFDFLLADGNKTVAVIEGKAI